MTIRPENPQEHRVISVLIQRAFADEQYSDHQEHLLVNRLRTSSAYIPELSLVVEVEGIVRGHIMFTKVKIGNSPSLALAPLSVHPKFQKQGIGTALVIEGHKRARDHGYGSVVVLGDGNYYSRFGYRHAREFGINFPFDVHEDHCQAIELWPGALEGVAGEIRYAEEFY